MLPPEGSTPATAELRRSDLSCYRKSKHLNVTVCIASRSRGGATASSWSAAIAVNLDNKAVEIDGARVYLTNKDSLLSGATIPLSG